MIPAIYTCIEKRPYYLKKTNVIKNYYYLIFTVAYKDSDKIFVKRKFSSENNALNFYSTLI